jgi:pSer/pThr/pTyr-binding forkhead associated (FHA) protein
MKKLILLFALFTFCFVSFAQKIFTATTLNEILTEYKKDSKAFFINRLSSDFRYTNPDGTYVNREPIISGDAQKIVSTEIHEPVIFQSGGLAVVSGIHQTERVEKDGSNNTSQVACTYTFQLREDKWMFVASQQTRIVKK